MDDTNQTGPESGPDAPEPVATPSHDRVFLVVVDDTPEMQAALTYACRRVRNSGGRLALLYVIEPAEIEPWMSVGDLIREERRQEAEANIANFSDAANAITGKLPVIYIREGSRRDQIIKLIDEEPSISILVLASGTGPEGPGPLVSHLVGKVANKMRVPITVVPGNLSAEEIERLT
ncbi:universal stress protein [Oceanibaculum pacificum]|uniref:Universal stress protein n=1 Tax=Oceanibaculum pacificum TaxID=580166 RepID=A0A154WFM5_9PROT|nr:universal stress protein [Oceanibaculum pacificum]KZD12328.1 universal stress protein [Oceanibaculum pacificum]